MRGLLLFTALTLVMIASVAYTLTLLDNIVHGTLYNYGLQFSYDWATPYWTFLRIIQVLLGSAALISLASQVYIYRKYIRVKPETKTTASEKLSAPSFPMEQPRSTSGLIKCTHCGKVFSQPLQMLDFRANGPRIIHICPFCNKVIQPVLRREESKRVMKAAQKEKENNRAKVLPELKEERQEPPKEKTKEAVTAQT